jgi:cellulose synthase/poly-beta-1,6-N-acetylglucosamine synthase-like glycosyltransferase
VSKKKLTTSPVHQFTMSPCHHVTMSPRHHVTTVTILIPARNEKENIGNILNDLVDQDFPTHLLEVVVIDDHSTDHTGERVLAFAQLHPTLNLRLIAANKAGNDQAFKKQAIRAGIEATSGDLIITTDADTRLKPGWINAIVDFYEKQKPRMIIAPVAFQNEKTFFERLQSMEFSGLMAATAGSCSMGFPLMCNGANLAFERTAYLETRDSSDLRYPSGDDLFLMMKIGKKFGSRSIKYLFTEEAIVSTSAKRSLREFVSQRLRWVSKSPGYSDPVVKAVAAITWLLNFLLLSTLVAGTFNRQLLILSLVLLGIKMVLEFPAVWRIMMLTGKIRFWFLYPFTQILNLVYVTLIGILGNLVSYEWKGRRINPLNSRSQE